MNARDELALTIHTHHCIESVHNEDCMFWADDHESAEAVRTAGYSKPRTITTVAQLYSLAFGSAVQTSGGSDTVVLRGNRDLFINQSGAEVPADVLWRYGTHPFTVIFEGATK